MSARGQQAGPQGWKRTTLGEALPIHYGKARNEKYGIVREDTPVYGSSGKIDTFKRALTGGPSLIIGRKGTVGATYYCPEPCWPIDTVYFAEASSDEDLRFFKYLLDHLQLARMDRSTAVPGLSRDDYNATEVFIPELDQQRSIVAEIEKQFSRLDEAVASLRRTKANLKRYKAAVLKAAVEGKLASTKQPWKESDLGDIATSIRNGYSKKPDAERGTRIFRISAVRPMELDANDARYLSGTPSDYQPFLVEPGDVLFTRYNGSRNYVGVCARIPAGLPPTVYPDKLIRVRVPDSILLPEFLVILASTGRAREYIESKIRTTAGQSGISGGDLKLLPLDIPRVEEQQQIVAEVERHLSVIEELEATVKANLTRVDRLRQAILASMFSTQRRNSV